MKRLLALILALMMCLSFTACKDKENSQNTEAKPLTKAELEHEIRVLMEQNLDCYYMFYVAPLSHTAQQNSDGYYGTDGAYLADYSALESKVHSTYVSETAEKLLSYPTATAPLYKDVDDKIFVKPDVITPVEYNILWDDNYTVELLETSDTKCTFKLTTIDFDSNPYTTNGCATYVDGKWLLDDLVY